MARLPRFFVPGEALHVIQRGNNREPVFAAETDHRFFLDCLLEATQRHGVLVHAYVLMTNHVHLLATPQRQQSMSKVLQSVGRRYVQYFNSSYQRTGTLWEGRYRATIVDGEQYLLRSATNGSRPRSPPCSGGEQSGCETGSLRQQQITKSPSTVASARA